MFDVRRSFACVLQSPYFFSSHPYHKRPKPHTFNTRDRKMIACITVVGKRNELLYLQTFLPPTDPNGSYYDPLRFHFLAHSALDAFDERSAGKSSRPPTSSASFTGANTANDMFLGHLCPIEEFRVYGYQTSTHLKLIAILTENEPVRENDLKNVLQGLHTLYVSYLQSPFSPLSGKITSARFAKGVERQVSVYNQSTSNSSSSSGGGGIGSGLAALSSSRLLASTSSTGTSSFPRFPT